MPLAPGVFHNLPEGYIGSEIARERRPLIIDPEMVFGSPDFGAALHLHRTDELM